MGIAITFIRYDGHCGLEPVGWCMGSAREVLGYCEQSEQGDICGYLSLDKRVKSQLILTGHTWPVPMIPSGCIVFVIHPIEVGRIKVIGSLSTTSQTRIMLCCRFGSTPRTTAEYYLRPYINYDNKTRRMGFDFSWHVNVNSPVPNTTKVNRCCSQGWFIPSAGRCCQPHDEWKLPRMIFIIRINTNYTVIDTVYM